MLTPVLLHLPTPADLPWIPRPAESHHAFAAGFLFIGSVLSIEALAGGVWQRNLARRMLFPAILVFLGWGMIAVAFIEPAARLVHVTMGLPMIAGGWAEARYRQNELDRRVADAFIVPALVLAAVDVLFFHLSGPRTVVLSHAGLGVMVLVIAALRLYQSAKPEALSRALYIAFAILAMCPILWIDAFANT
jgi:hypothetical protein